MSAVAFAKLWQTDLTRECFLEHATKDDLRSMRLVSHDFADTIAPILFKTVTVDFDVNSFSRRPRMAALDRVGFHVKNLTFHLPHTETTFLPPLMDPDSLEEINFLYEPQRTPSRPSSSSSTSSGSKYGSWELNDILVRQYPPLFHAATNIPSFIRALSTLPCLRHLKISCPGQPSGQRYRRSIVDYAMISLRIAIETCNPVDLKTLTLDPIHSSSVFHLRPHISLGCSPASSRVWGRITTLTMKMDSFDFSTSNPTDHLKILHTYIQSFSSLENFTFHWLGTTKGPCPLSLDTEPCTSHPSSMDYCSNACPESRTQPPFRPLKLRKLRSMYLENALLDSCQASDFIIRHRKMLHEFQFERCDLRSGTWDDALAPLTRISGSESWKTKDIHPPSLPALSTSSSFTSTSTFSTTTPIPEPISMDVPLILSPAEEVAIDPFETVREQLWFDATDTTRRHKGIDLLKRVGYRSRDAVGTVALDGIKKFLLRRITIGRKT